MENITNRLGDTAFAEKCSIVALLDSNFAKDITSYLERKIESAKDLEELFADIYSKLEKSYATFLQAEILQEKIYNLEITLAYYSLLESLDETSYILEYILDGLKRKYGKEYIVAIAEVDKEILSADTNTFLQKEGCKKEYAEDLLNMYVTLKRWQDILHVYSVEKLDAYVFSVEDAYIRYFAEKYVDIFPLCNKRMYENNAAKALLLEQKYLAKQIVSAEEVCSLLFARMDSEIVQIYGGKAYGLARLLAAGANIPQTYFVSFANYASCKEEVAQVFAGKKLAVRSSANVEDGKNNSFAGMFASFLDVDIYAVDTYICKVMQSAESSKVTEYTKKTGISSIRVSVVLQTFAEPEYAGIFLGQEVSRGITEYVEGNGEKLVSGSVTPVTKEITCESKHSVAKYFLQLQEKLGEICDFEYCVLDGKLVMLQFRPVTKIITTTLPKETLGKNEYSGIAASCGKHCGKSTYVRTLAEADNFTKGDILMCWYTNPEWVPLIAKASAVVTAVGGFLCHTAIIAREFGIPCVIAIGGDNMKKIWGESKLEVDGDRGIVTVVKEGEKNV